MHQLRGATLTYDNNGNLLTDGTNTHVWNARDQLASLSGGVTASFGYDAFNRRRTKTIAGTKTDFLYDGLNFVQEKDGATVKANLFTGLGIDEVFRRTQGAVTSDVLPDALGSSVALSDSTKAITTQYSYAPYGTTTQTGPANDNAQRFTGREDDGVTGLYYYRARYYSPKYSRFVAEDPIDLAGGPNIYAYVGGNPISRTDPTGLKCPSWDVTCDNAERAAGLPPTRPMTPGEKCRVDCNLKPQVICTLASVGVGAMTNPATGALTGGACVIVKVLVCEMICGPTSCDTDPFYL